MAEVCTSAFVLLVSFVHSNLTCFQNPSGLAEVKTLIFITIFTVSAGDSYTNRY